MNTITPPQVLGLAGCLAAILTVVFLYRSLYKIEKPLRKKEEIEAQKVVGCILQQCGPPCLHPNSCHWMNHDTFEIMFVVTRDEQTAEPLIWARLHVSPASKTAAVEHLHGISNSAYSFAYAVSNEFNIREITCCVWPVYEAPDPNRTKVSLLFPGMI